MKNVTPLPEFDWDGKKISVPGIYRNVPMSAYHHDLCAGPSISSGGLRTIEEEDGNMEEFFDGWYGNPDRIDDAPNDALTFGQAVHLLFGGETGFKERFLVRPDTYPNDPSKPWSGNSTDCKKWLAEAALSGKRVLKPEWIGDIRAMAEKLAKHPTIQTGLLNGLVERSIVWKRRILCSSGRWVTIWLKARPDCIPTDSLIVADFKSCADAKPIAVRRALTDHAYHQQLALIQEGIFATTGRRTTDHILVFQKKTRPYSINIKPVDPISIEYGHRQNRRAMQAFAEALDTGFWPGYADDEVPAGLMDYMTKRLAKEAEDHLLPEIDPAPDFDDAPAESEEAI